MLQKDNVSVSVLGKSLLMLGPGSREREHASVLGQTILNSYIALPTNILFFPYKESQNIANFLGKTNVVSYEVNPLKLG